MSALELEIQEAGASRTERLAAGLTRIGGPGCEIVLAGGGADQLHLWDSPPKLIFVGKGERPRVDGRAVEEASLTGGERIEWLGAVLSLRRPAEPVLREIPLPAAAASSADESAWTRVRAGILAELGLAERAAVSRWQEAVVAGTFDPEACARDLSARANVPPGDARVLDRSSRLLRDLLMAPYQRGIRGAGRKVRGATRSGLAFLLAQLVVLLVFAVLFAILLLIVRLRWGWSVDGFLDGLIDLLPG